MNTGRPNNPGQNPAFINIEQCRAWLTRLPLTNPPQAQADLLQQLTLLNTQALPASERISLLEFLRKTIAGMQHEAQRRFAGKALPLAPAELAAFESTQALWQASLVGYRHCLLTTLADGAPADAALPIARALCVLAESQLDSYRAGYLPAPEHWRTLHELFGTAERLGIADMEVTDPIRFGKAPFPLRAAYVEPLLLNLAGPNELPLRHLGWISTWARRWAAKVGVVAAEPGPEVKVLPVYVNLAAAEPAGYKPVQGAGGRWLDTGGLRTSLKKRIALLDSGAEPVTLQLGSDCVQPTCGRLLKQVYRRWCKGGASRLHDRQPIDGKCQLIVGVEAIHYFVSDRKPFRQPVQASDDVLRREREEIATFGRLQSRSPEASGQQQGYRAEEWQIVEEWRMHNESANGLHLSHPAGQTRTRIAQGQLVAIVPAGAPHPFLACLRWATVNAGTDLHTGLTIMPGRPEAIAASSDGIDGSGERYRRAFLLPSVPALDVPATIITPSGWFKSDRRLEVYTDRLRQIKLLQIVDRGNDFDRASYEFLS